LIHLVGRASRLSYDGRQDACPTETGPGLRPTCTSPTTQPVPTGSLGIVPRGPNPRKTVVRRLILEAENLLA
jgi:hypothetical protein